MPSGQGQKFVLFFSFFSPFKNHVACIKNIGDKVSLHLLITDAHFTFVTFPLNTIGKFTRCNAELMHKNFHKIWNLLNRLGLDLMLQLQVKCGNIDIFMPYETERPYLKYEKRRKSRGLIYCWYQDKLCRIWNVWEMTVSVSYKWNIYVKKWGEGMLI